MNMILQSEQLDQLFTALAKAQGEMDSASLTSSNPFFKSKYAPLSEIMKASRPALAKHGLSVIQKMVVDDNGVGELHTVLCHASGQWVSSVMKISPQKADVQSLGSYITYLKRYAYTALVGVVVCDEDDDGESAVDRAKLNQVKSLKPEPTHIPTEQKPSVSIEFLDPEQLTTVGSELVGFKDIYNVIISEFDKLQNIPKSKFKSVMEYIKTEKGKLI